MDLTAFYNTLAEEYGWAEDAASSGEEDIMMMNLEGDMLEGLLSRPGRCGHQAADRQSPHDQRRGE